MNRRSGKWENPPAYMDVLQADMSSRVMPEELNSNAGRPEENLSKSTGRPLRAARLV